MANAKRLIDATDAEKWARDHIRDTKELPTILDFLRDCSTVDAVEVVRCKDCCRNSNEVCRIMQLEMKPDDFCSYGERVVR